MSPFFFLSLTERQAPSFSVQSQFLVILLDPHWQWLARNSSLATRGATQPGRLAWDRSLSDLRTLKLNHLTTTCLQKLHIYSLLYIRYLPRNHRHAIQCTVLCYSLQCSIIVYISKLSPLNLNAEMYTLLIQRQLILRNCYFKIEQGLFAITIEY